MPCLRGIRTELDAFLNFPQMILDHLHPGKTHLLLYILKRGGKEVKKKKKERKSIFLFLAALNIVYHCVL